MIFQILPIMQSDGLYKNRERKQTDWEWQPLVLQLMWELLQKSARIVTHMILTKVFKPFWLHP
jgi:hypothetical protein